MGPGQLDRINWVDAAKGLSIILVVFGHVFPPPIGPSVRLLRMPFFFFLSGYVFKPRATADFLWKRGASLLVPYGFYIVLITIVGAAGYVAADPGHASALAALPGREILKGGSYMTGYYGQLWFLTTLFAALMIYNFALGRYLSPLNWPMVAIVVLATLAGYALEHRQTYFAVGVAPIALVFIWAGSAYRQINVPRWMVTPAALIVAVALYRNDSFDMKAAEYGAPIFTILAAVAACYLTTLACTYLVQLRWFRTTMVPIGMSSLVIMALHQSVALRLAEHLQLHPFIVFPIAVALPFSVYLLVKPAGWFVRWLFIGVPPALPKRIPTAFKDRPSRL